MNNVRNGLRMLRHCRRQLGKHLVESRRKRENFCILIVRHRVLIDNLIEAELRHECVASKHFQDELKKEKSIKTFAHRFVLLNPPVSPFKTSFPHPVVMHSSLGEVTESVSSKQIGPTCVSYLMSFSRYNKAMSCSRDCGWN